MKKAIRIILITASLWLAITTIVFRIKNPEQSEMQVFIHIPKSFVLDFERRS